VIRQHKHTTAHALLLAAALMSACGGPPPAPVEPEPTGPTIPTVPPPPLPQASATTGPTVRLANGITAHFQTNAVGSDTLIQLGIFGGSTVASPGLAELTAQVVIESSDPTSGRASLSRQLEAIGANIDVQVGTLTTWLDIRTPSNKLAETLQALRGAIESITQSRSQIDRMRDELVAKLVAQIAAKPSSMLARTLLQGERGTDSFINSLLDLDPSDVSLFHGRFYRPETSLLAIATPKHAADVLKAIQEPAETSIGQWRPRPAIPGKPRFLSRPYASGLYWAEAPGPKGLVQASIVMQLPDAGTARAAEWLVMHACLTLDGTGGRFEQMLTEAELPPTTWRARIEQTADAQALVLSAQIPTTIATSVWQVFEGARQSLTQVPPTQSELELALRRSQLNATLPTMSAAARLRLAATMANRKLEPGVLAARLRQLADPSSWDANQAAAAFQKTPAWMIVTGPAPAPEVPGVIPFDLLPEGFATSQSAKPTPKIIATTGPWLTKARAAAGGADAFAKINGFEAMAELTADQAPKIQESLSWFITGQLTRKREVLGQTVTTNLVNGVGTETLGKAKSPLKPRDAQLLRHEVMRHPLMLLAANLKGRIKFRPVAQRKSGDRELMVLEAVGPEFDRLRIHIDTESFLIRIVESWERLADDTLVHIHETWSDYRAAGPLRAPYRLRTTWNDGEHQTETVFSEWRATSR